jgi:hypothetical protein
MQVPHVRWDDIGGQLEAKQSLREMVEWPLMFAAAFTALGVRPPSGKNHKNHLEHIKTDQGRRAAVLLNVTCC